MRKGLTLIELLVVIVILVVLISLGYPAFNRWYQKNRIESATRKIYSEIEYQRMRAYSQGLRLKLEATDKKLIVVNLDNPNDRFVVDLGAPFSGVAYIDRRGILNSGSIIYSDELDSQPSLSCVIFNGVRVRMGKVVVDNEGRRKCR